MWTIFRLFLFVKAGKYKGPALTVAFLGLIVSAGSIHVDPAKVKAAVDWHQAPNQEAFAAVPGLSLGANSTLATPSAPVHLPSSGLLWQTTGALVFVQTVFESAFDLILTITTHFVDIHQHMETETI